MLIDPALEKLNILSNTAMNAVTWLPLLLSFPNAALMVLAFVLLSMVRSAVLGAGINLQAILYVTGMQGMGKTTLARRLVSFITRVGSPYKPALIFDLGSSLAGLRTAMTEARDLPIVVDDACKSISKNVERKRNEVLAQVLREATNAAPIVKSVPGGGQVELENAASIMLTAETKPENASDLTRCILVNILEQPNLPDELTPDMVSEIVRTFLEYFLDHAEALLASLKSEIHCSRPVALENCTEPRVRTNLLVLRWVFRTMLDAAREASANASNCERLAARFDNALEESVDSFNHEMDALKANVPDGNLAYILLNGYLNKEFSVLKNDKKLHKLSKRDGIIWKGDLCLRSLSLETFVRKQNGYHDWNLNRIVNTLLDYGAICIHEEHTKQVKLFKKKGIPRVYRIKLDILKDNAVRY